MSSLQKDSEICQFSKCPQAALSHTCDCALAGVSSGQSPDPVRGVWDLIPAVLDEDGVSASHVRHVGHQVGAVVVVTDVGLLWLPLWILGVGGRDTRLIPVQDSYFKHF